MKNPVSFRLSDDGLGILRMLARRNGVSCSSIVELAIREKAKRDGLEEYLSLSGVSVLDWPARKSRKGSSKEDVSDPSASHEGDKEVQEAQP